MCKLSIEKYSHGKWLVMELIFLIKFLTYYLAVVLGTMEFAIKLVLDFHI